MTAEYRTQCAIYTAMIEHGVDGFCTSLNDSVVKWHKKHALLQKPSSGD